MRKVQLEQRIPFPNILVLHSYPIFNFQGYKLQEIFEAKTNEFSMTLFLTILESHPFFFRLYLLLIMLYLNDSYQAKPLSSILITLN